MMEKNLINQVVNVIKSIQEENPKINLFGLVKKELNIAFTCAEFLRKAGLDLRLTDRVDFLVSTLWQMNGNEKLKKISKSLYQDEKFVSSLEEVLVQYFKDGSEIKVDGPSQKDQVLIDRISKKISEYAESIPFEGDDMDFSIPVADEQGNPLEPKICEKLNKEDMVTGEDGETYCNSGFHDCEGCNSPNAAEATFYRKEAKKHRVYEEALEMIAQLRGSMVGSIYGDGDDSDEESKERTCYDREMWAKFTVIQLRHFAKELQLKGFYNLSKAELIELIIEAKKSQDSKTQNFCETEEKCYTTDEEVEAHLMSMNLIRLKEIAKEFGVKGVSRTPKAELVKILVKVHQKLKCNDVTEPCVKAALEEDPIDVDYAVYTNNSSEKTCSDKPAEEEVPSKKGFFGKVREVVSGMVSHILRGI